MTFDPFFVLLMLFSLYGIGELVRTRLCSQLPEGYTVPIGLSVLILVGGLLNLVGGSDALALIILLAGGCVLGAFFVVRKYRELYERISAKHGKAFKKDVIVEWIPMMVLTALLSVAFVAHSQPSALNVHDDYEKYLKYPVRMLATGSLDTSVFDSQGYTALGSMSFLQGFALLFGSIALVNSMDAVVCLAGCLLLARSSLKAFGLDWKLQTVGVLAVFLIDPLYVNVSSIYSSAMMIMLVSTTPFLLDGENRGNSWRGAVVVGLGYAALVSLKTSIAIFVPLHFAAITLVRYARSRQIKTVLKEAVLVALFSVLFVLPWFGIHYAKYSQAFNLYKVSVKDDLGPVVGKAIGGWNPFATETLFYGFKVSYLSLTIFVVSLLAMTLFCLVQGKGKKRTAGVLVGVSLSLVGCYILGMGVYAPRLVGYLHGVRYLMPLFIAATIAFPIGLSLLSDSVLGRVTSWLLIGCSLCVFPFSVSERYGQAFKYGNSLGVKALATEEYSRYSGLMLGDEGSAWAQKVQETIPGDHGLFLWSTLSFQFDYERNKIWDMDPSGLTGPWVDFPFDANPSVAKNYFIENEINYIVWQYDGFGVRDSEQVRLSSLNDFPKEKQASQRMLAIEDHFNSWSTSPSEAAVIYDDGVFRVLKL